jgi:transposase
MPASKAVLVPAGSSASPRRRRRWPLEQKRRIVEATLAPGASIAAVAREHGVNANQLHLWRRLLESGRLGSKDGPASLLPVRITDAPATTQRWPAEGPSRRARGSSRPHVETPRGRLLIEGAPDVWTLRTVLESLLG